MSKDIAILRDLAKQYSEISRKEIQEQRRMLWAAHNAFKEVRPPIYIRHAAWLLEAVGDQMQCEDPFYRRYEYFIRSAIFHDTLADDYIIEPWITQQAIYDTTGEDIWGLPVKRIHTEKKSVTKYIHPLKDPEDFHKMTVPDHRINWEKTNAAFDRLTDAIGDIVEVRLDTTPLLNGFFGDLSTVFGRLRGFEQMLWDMVDNPEWLHQVMAFMRDGVLRVQQQIDRAF